MAPGTILTRGALSGQVYRGAQGPRGRGELTLGLGWLPSPWLLGGTTSGGAWSHVLASAALIVLSIPRRTVRQRYGGWDRYVR